MEVIALVDFVSSILGSILAELAAWAAIAWIESLRERKKAPKAPTYHGKHFKRP